MNPGKLPLAWVDAEVQAHCGFHNPGQACASRGDREEHLGAVTVTAGEPEAQGVSRANQPWQNAVTKNLDPGKTFPPG